MKRKNVIVNLITTIGLGILFSVLSVSDSFEKLDFRAFDSLTKIKKEVPKCEKILLVNADDQSILSIGEWPWSRDVIADALLRMKELDAAYAVFDIEYISPSQLGISPSAPQKIQDRITRTHNSINDSLDQISTALGNKYYSNSELQSILENYKETELSENFTYLEDYINSSMYRDNDEYFGQCVQFFGNTFLTVNNRDLGYKVTDEEADYIKKRLLYKNVVDDTDRIGLDNDYTSQHAYDGLEKGFQPALHSLVSHAKGVGFTNSFVDSDGVRRRFEVLYEYDGTYLGQLSIAPLLKILDVQKVTRSKNSFIFHDCLFPGETERTDLKIPLDNHGRMIVSWRKGRLADCFNCESIIALRDLDTFEAQIIQALKNISYNVVIDENYNVLPYYQDVFTLLQTYSEITDYKEYLLSLCTGYTEDGVALDGITDSDYESYFGARNSFFDMVKDFLNAGYLPEIKDYLNANYAGYSSDDIELLASYFDEDFDALKGNYDTYQSFMSDMKPIYKDAYCIIGQTAASTVDLGATPLNEKFENVGLHADVMNTVLNKAFITYVNWYWAFGVAFILALLLILLSGKPQHIQNLVGGIVVVVVIAALVLLYLFFDIYIPFVSTMLFIVLAYVGGVLSRFIADNIEKKFITQVAASFANKDTVEELRKNPEMFKTGGEKKCITALFSDIQKFSTLSEQIAKIHGDEAPNKLIAILNEYLGTMSNAILENGGNIDKYEGDAIISMFGAPDVTNSHTSSEWAYLCLLSAIKMKEVEVEFNETHKDLFEPVTITKEDGSTEVVQLKPLQTRIGINSGEAFVGLMGSQLSTFSKLNYTMIGDTVNLASRLEGVNKVYKSWIMCSDDTWNLANQGIHRDEILVKKLDRVRVVGRSNPVQLYNVLGLKANANPTLIKELEIFNAAMDEYNNGNFVQAGKLFISASDILADDTAIVYANRCKEFIENGVPENWDGVISMTSK